ncbi:Ppx/GppA phosphatase family protein [Nevskia sp.]|uniref:Ppx/GppA phosphatase family protein n=1 Tax=Nevskia sp. TaxID=1929292 RepID=UPI0025FA9238|nr:Ppx/GppA phosphatase family protein [Nevskia sp.]
MPRSPAAKSASASRRTAKPATQAGEVAAVDLGSNSFHMLVARDSGGQLQVVDRLRDAVRLAAGLDARLMLSLDAETRALACLKRFGQRLRGIPADRVRVVGTNTMRRLADGGKFMQAAEKALGHEIEVISGVEEARLVYSGVTHGLGKPKPRRLVVDIGGGSTELIIGHGAMPKLMESTALGCVTHTQRFFADGVVTRARMQEARLAARVELEFVERQYRAAGWDVAIGASGTVRGVWRVARGQGWADEAITRSAVNQTVELAIRAGNAAKFDFPGLRDDRRPVFAGGLAVLAGVFDSLGIEAMETSEHALREGLIYDLLGRLSDNDVRSRSVEAMATRYGVDREQARDVERTALKLLEQVHAGWQLDREAATRLLRWAALLHEIGLVIAHEGSHRHGEYMLRHAELFGFSQTDQRLVAALVRLQRGKFAQGALDDLPLSWQTPIRRLAVLFRLAIVLHRSRAPGLRIPFELSAAGKQVRLELRSGWLDKHPLTREDLEQEADHLVAAGFKLRFG